MAGLALIVVSPTEYSYYEFQKGRYLYEYLRSRGWKSSDIVFLSKEGDPYPSQGEATRNSVIKALERIRGRSTYNNDLLIYVSNPSGALEEELEAYRGFFTKYAGQVTDSFPINGSAVEAFNTTLTEHYNVELPTIEDTGALASELNTLLDHYLRVDLSDIAWLNLGVSGEISQRLYLDELENLLDDIKRDRLYFIGCGKRSGILMDHLKRHDRAVITSMTAKQEPEKDRFDITWGTVDSGTDDLLRGFFHELDRMQRRGYIDDQYPLVNFDPEKMDITGEERTVRPPGVGTDEITSGTTIGTPPTDGGGSNEDRPEPPEGGGTDLGGPLEPPPDILGPVVAVREVLNGYNVRILSGDGNDFIIRAQRPDQMRMDR